MAVLILPSAPLSAQTNGEEIAEIQVTATRRPADISDVSAALTIVTTEDIARASLTTDALAAQPGVFLQQTTPGQGAAIVRGLKGSEVLHLVDGMRLNNAIFRNAPTQYLALVAPGTLERIEIVRGAPASLYGSDAVGGVVQVLSRSPFLEGQDVRGNAFLGLDSGDLSQILRGSVEFGDESLAALVSGEYVETGNRRTGGGERVGPSGFRSRGARFAVSAYPEDGQSWLFDLQAARQPGTPRFDELVPGFGEIEPSSSEFFFAPNDRLFAHVQHTREDGWWGASWRFDIGWQRIVDDRITRGFQSGVRRSEQNSSDLTGLTASASKGTDSGSWIAGIELYHDEVSSSRIDQDIPTGVTQTVTPRFPDGSTVDQAAVFGNLSHSLSDRQSLSAGLRYSAIETEITASLLAPGSVVNQNDWSADVGWVFDITTATQFLLNLGYGFRAPNVFDLGTLGERPGNRFNIPNPNLTSERITQFDVGIRHRSERFDLDLVLFTLQYTDRISSVLTGDVTPDGRDVTQSQNVDSADIVGVELSGRYEMTPGLSAEFVLNTLRGEQSDSSGATVPGDRIPPVNGRLAVDWQWSDTFVLRPSVIFAAAQDRLSPRDVRDNRIDPNGTAGWVTLNIEGGWQAEEWLLVTAGIANLLDQRYRVHGSGIDAVGRSLFINLQTRW